jgi:hypothetical protein
MPKAGSRNPSLKLYQRREGGTWWADCFVAGERRRWSTGEVDLGAAESAAWRRREELITQAGRPGRKEGADLALLAGLDHTPGAVLYSFDIAPAQVTPAALDLATWYFTQANTATLPGIPECDLLFIDTLHTCDQVRAELQYSGSVRRGYPDVALEAEGRVIAYYAGVNPNGSQRDIAGICNEAGNVVGLMPHPEHAVEALTGPGTDGLGFFTSILTHLAAGGSMAGAAQGAHA